MECVKTKPVYPIVGCRSEGLPGKGAIEIELPNGKKILIAQLLGPQGLVHVRLG